jgi:gamma-glutamylcyclotransferase (GGCT)/AIG2-like uncharacterized protein YtfP
MKMPDEPERLFVYGTLRPSFGEEGTSLVRHMKAEGPATARGLLYDLGSYPGMVRGDGVVHGELLQITQPADLEALDHYEECGGPWPLFRREPMEVLRPDGEAAIAWVYLYARSVEGATFIDCGDYLARARER